MTKNKKLVRVAIFAVAIFATGGAAWLSAQSAQQVGGGKMVQVLRTPT